MHLKRYFIFLLILFSFSSLFFRVSFALQNEKLVPLYKNGAPDKNGLENEEEINQGPFKRNVSEAKYSIYLPEKNKSNGKLIIYCPGGAYISLAFDEENKEIAKMFNKNGYSYMVLYYRLPNLKHHQIPGNDLKQAVIVARENSKKWNINPDKIGFMGFSAGGHLAATGAFLFEKEYKPKFLILYSPVISMEKKYAHNHSRLALLGRMPSSKIIEKYSLEKQINKESPPVFIAYSKDDEVVDPKNSELLIEALIKNKRNVEKEVFNVGGHAFFAYPENKEILNKKLIRWLDKY